MYLTSVNKRSLVNLANDPNFSKDDLQEILRRLPNNPDSERDDEGQTLALIASRYNSMLQYLQL